MVKNIGVLGIAGWMAAMSMSVCAEELDTLAERLIDLRSQVEELSQELDIVKEEHRIEMGSLAAQKAELEASRNRLETQIQQMRRELDEHRGQAQLAGVDNDALKPVLFAALDALQGHVAASLPFKRDERLAELATIRGQIDTGVVPPNRAANRLWGFYEDEIRLTRENGVYSQTIEIGQERLLAEVAKLGSVMMFFRTQDGRVGRAEPGTDGWTFRVINDNESIAAVEVLFDALRKQIRQGYFELPLITREGRS